jgi:hypothetical protein
VPGGHSGFARRRTTGVHTEMAQTRMDFPSGNDLMKLYVRIQAGMRSERGPAFRGNRCPSVRHRSVGGHHHRLGLAPPAAERCVERIVHPPAAQQEPVGISPGKVSAFLIVELP